MVSKSIIILLGINLSSTTTLNNLFSHHCFSRSIKEEIEFENYEMLGLGTSE